MANITKNSIKVKNNQRTGIIPDKILFAPSANGDILYFHKSLL